ncbi:hypothetical protein BOTBODRAFT_60316 [Botryobasidium botryosum FD-172 SS1]|uniref:F-box domain-containing protein n=1 Tax=Botryobasidium botryosum (strain FD-172 SS1) TaxID=930990 RepID=A0A067LV31_BOTB1|nr:hypothetical protein BOTBODRAFT_60316 [Botryobasidium botryosum FD-172 SS1]
MEKIATDAIPQLIQRLCEEIFQQSEASAKLEDLRAQVIPFDYTPPFKSMGSSSREALERMDEELEVMMRACDYAVHAMVTYTNNVLNSVKARRNEHCPIYRLPSEIITTIFHFARQCSLGSDDGLLRSAPVSLSQVSKWWRNIALSTPALWTKIDSQNVILAELFANRSKNELLDIDVDLEVSSATYDFNYIRAEDLLQFLTPHIDRWESFVFCGDCEYGPLDSPAPNLQTLQLRADWDSHAHYNINIFSNHAPLLRTLKLARFYIDLDAHLHAGLESLHLCDSLILGPPNKFAAMSLAACPLLRELVLHDVRFHGILDSMPGNRSVPLHHLEVMRLKMDDREIRSLISSLQTPSSLRLCITMQDSNDLRTMFPVSQTHQWPPSNIAAIDTLSIIADSADEAGGVHVVGESLQNHMPLLELHFPAFSAYRDAPRIASIAAHLGPMIALTILSIHSTFDQVIMNANMFNTLLLHSPALTAISLRNVPAGFVDTLVFTHTTPHCPLLQSLHLQEMDLGLVDVILLARSRRHHNTNGRRDLSRITISNCRRVKEAMITGLRGLSVEVIWDDEGSGLVGETVLSLNN